MMDKNFEDPDGIAVDDSGAVPVVYVSEGSYEGPPKVNKCAWHIGQSEEWFNCSDFGGSNASWTIPHGLAVDSEGNVFITYHYWNAGVWKCSPSADCTSVGDTDLWLHYLPERVAVDSQGNVYVSGQYEQDTSYVHDNNASYVKKCTSTGTCADFGGDWPKNGGGRNPIAVGSDDTVCIIDSSTNTLIRCSPDNVCEKVDVGAFQGAKSMVIDRNSALYIMDDGGLHRVCLSPSMNDIQV
jgi:DNA-binding beta-propeller fold protein YncE